MARKHRACECYNLGCICFADNDGEEDKLCTAKTFASSRGKLGLASNNSIIGGNHSGA